MGIFSVLFGSNKRPQSDSAEYEDREENQGEDVGGGAEEEDEGKLKDSYSISEIKFAVLSSGKLSSSDVSLEKKQLFVNTCIEVKGSKSSLSKKTVLKILGGLKRSHKLSSHNCESIIEVLKS